MNISKVTLSLLIVSVVLAGCAANPDALQLANQSQWEMQGHQDGTDQYEFEVLNQMWQRIENDRYGDLMQEDTQQMN